jgi:hypothetical protein
LKISEVAQIFGLATEMLRIDFAKKWVGFLFGRQFHKHLATLETSQIKISLECHWQHLFFQYHALSPTRVARVFIFKPKIPNWINFGGPYVDWTMCIYFMAIWNILLSFGLFFDHLVHFVLIWCIFAVLLSCTKKNLATPSPTASSP